MFSSYESRGLLTLTKHIICFSVKMALRGPGVPAPHRSLSPFLSCKDLQLFPLQPVHSMLFSFLIAPQTHSCIEPSTGFSHSIALTSSGQVCKADLWGLCIYLCFCLFIITFVGFVCRPGVLLGLIQPGTGSLFLFLLYPFYISFHFGSSSWITRCQLGRAQSSATPQLLSLPMAATLVAAGILDIFERFYFSLFFPILLKFYSLFAAVIIFLFCPCSLQVIIIL